MKKILLIFALVSFSLSYSQTSPWPFVDSGSCGDYQLFYDMDTQTMVLMQYQWSSAQNKCVLLVANVDGHNEGSSCGEYDAGGTWLGPCPPLVPTGCPVGQNCDDVPGPE